MAGLATDIWEYRATNGNANNGGGYDSAAGTTDYSDQNAAEAQFTNLSTAGIGSTALTDDDGGGSFTAQMVGNYIQIRAGTNVVAGFYRVTAFTDGDNVTIDRACDDGVGGLASGDGDLGGALDILIDSFFDGAGAVIVPGSTIYIKNDGTMTLGGGISTLLDGTSTALITIEGYNSSRGDNPTGTNRPLIAAGANSFTFDDYWLFKNFRLTSTSIFGLDCDNNNLLVNLQANNSSGTATRAALSPFFTYNYIIKCEAQSLEGYAIRSYSYVRILSCYVHDSESGIEFGAAALGNHIITGTVIDTCEFGIDGSSTSNDNLLVANNTIINCTVGILGNSGAGRWTNINNIISDNITGASWGAENKSNFWDYNIWNNGTDTSNVTKGENAVTADPLLNITLVTGANGTTEVGDETDFRSVGATFQTDNVSTSDALIIHSGTGVVVGVYNIVSIDSETQLTISAGATTSASNCVYGIVTNEDFTLQGGSPAIDAGLDATDAGATV